MSIEIPAMVNSGQKPPLPDLYFFDKTVPQPGAGAEKTGPNREMSKMEIDGAMDALAKAASIFNKRLKFSINDELGIVIVKIIDEETDKVLKEIPPTEIQAFIARLKETIGLFIDEKI
jgi:flagellar protein FlaG